MLYISWKIAMHYTKFLGIAKIMYIDANRYNNIPRFDRGFFFLLIFQLFA